MKFIAKSFRMLKNVIKLRDENYKLRKEVALHKWVAQQAWDCELPSPLPGHKRQELEDFLEHYNCPYCKGSGHIDDMDEADRQVKAQLNYLSKTVELLIQNMCVEQTADNKWVGAPDDPKGEPVIYETKQEAVASWKNYICEYKAIPGERRPRFGIYVPSQRSGR